MCIPQKLMLSPDNGRLCRVVLGLLTVAMLMRNTLQAAKWRRGC